MENSFQKVVSFFIYTILLIFPFFFLNLTQEFFTTNKLYLLAFGGLLLLFLSVIHLLIFKKISWQKHPFDNLVLLFISAISVSVIFSSPNKIQAILNPSYGLLMMVSLAIFYFYLSRSNGAMKQLNNVVIIAASFILSLITIVFYFQPFKNVNLSQAFAFLKNPGFSPLGNQLDLAVFLGFFAVLGIAQIITRPPENEYIKTDNKSVIINFSLLTFNLIALFLTVYSLIKTQIVLPPFRLSWYAALDTLKSPITALIGVGVDNFSAIFTTIKDYAYNQSPLWQVNSFNVSRSAILQILTETGLFGLLSFGLLYFVIVKQLLTKSVIKKSYLFICLFVYLFICLFIFPTSLIVWFLFFVLLAIMSQQYNNGAMKQSINLGDLLPLYIGIVIFSLGMIGGAGYFIGRSYASEYYYKKSLDGYVNNSVQELYNNQRQAIIFNPFIEKYHLSFSQTNLLIADNLSKKNSGKISDQDRQTITQAIQASIAEAKSAVSLNSLKAANWENLALIYRNIINVVQGSDTWTISAYQRAIVLDPQNALYRIDLGGVYYSLAKYDDAANFFQQAIGIKPDYPNAQYNYAWAAFQRKDYSQAALSMQNVLNLLDPKTNKTDYDKAQKDLEEFKKMLPTEKAPTATQEAKPGNLTLPSPPATKISPKLELPKTASPEAK